MDKKDLLADEQVFNQEELEDIMSEIESLEEEFASEEVATDPVLEALAEEIVQVTPVDDLEIQPEERLVKTALQEEIDNEVELLIKAEPVEPLFAPTPVPLAVAEPTFEETPEVEVSPVPENVVPMKPAPTPAPVAPAPSCGPVSSGTKMDFSIEGDISMVLGFNFQGTFVKLSVNGSEGFIIEMPHGMKFTIPVEQLKKAV